MNWWSTRHKPQPPPPPQPRPVHVSIWRDGAPLTPTGGLLRLDDGKPPIVGRVAEGHRLYFEVSPDTSADFGSYGNGCHIGITIEGEETVWVDSALAQDIDLAIEVQKSPLQYLNPLDRRGQFYYRDGQPHTVIESSDFRLYERFLKGEDIEPVLADRSSVGMNCLRVWLLNTSVGHIVPSEWGDVFYDRIPEFIGRCGAHGLDIEFTVFTQTQTLLPKLGDQQAHYDRVVAAIGAKFCFVEGVNEADSHDNAVHPGLLMHKPAGATFDLCRGSNGADAWLLEPVIDSSRYHSNDTNEWWRRQAHNGMEMADATGKPNIANENTRPDRDPNPYRFFDAAAGAALLSAGSCFHSTSGKDSVIYAGMDRLCAVQHALGAKSADLSQRVFPYERHDELNGSQNLRFYRRGSCSIPIRK